MVEKSSKKIWIGYFFAISFCIATALSVTMIHLATTHLDPFFSLFMTTLLGILYFNGVSFSSIKNSYRSSYSSKVLWLIISLFVAGNWATTFFALSLINPFIFIFTYFSASGLIAAFFEYSRARRITDLFYLLGITVLLVFFLEKTILQVAYSNKIAIGCAVSIISAGCGYGYRRFSYIFSQKTELNAVRVLSVRFYFLLLLSIFFMRWSDFYLLNWNVIIHFLLLTAFTFIIPLYCMQKSVLIIGAENFSVLTSLCPAATALLLLVVDHAYDTNYLVLSGAVVLMTCYKFFGRHLAKKILSKAV